MTEIKYECLSRAGSVLDREIETMATAGENPVSVIQRRADLASGPREWALEDTARVCCSNGSRSARVFGRRPDDPRAICLCTAQFPYVATEIGHGAHARATPCRGNVRVNGAAV